MRELQSFLTRVFSDYFQLYIQSAESNTDKKELLYENKALESAARRVVTRTIDLFLRHTTLLRPLSENGRLRLASDFSQLELALVPLCDVALVDKSKKASTPPSDRELARVIDGLHSCKNRLLFADGGEDKVDELRSIVFSLVDSDAVACSIVSQFLISAHGPKALKLPHEHLNWSVTRYNHWLDSHPREYERLQLLWDSVQSYKKLIAAQENKNYHHIFPVLHELLEKGLAANV